MRTIITIIACASIFCSSAQSLTERKSNTMKHFDGPYLGVDIGIQNVFGGSFVNDMDILAQDYKLVTELAVGYRAQLLEKRLVTGLEFSVGFLNGSLEHSSQSEPLFINYDNSFQYSVGINIGVALGKHRRYMLFGYLNETKRKFAVDISQFHYNYTQRDKQGMLKYGIGLELSVMKRINVKATFGGLRVDFGDLETNIDVEDKYDFTFGINYQF